MVLSSIGKSKSPNGFLKKTAMFFHGFALLLTLRIGLNAGTFCLKRFMLDESIFGLYVSRVHNAMELGCFLAAVLGNVYVVLVDKGIEYVSIATNWMFFLVNVLLLCFFITGGPKGYITLFYWTLVASAFIYGLNQIWAFKLGGPTVVYHLAGVPMSGIFVSAYQYLFLKRFGDRREFETDFLLVMFQIALSIFITVITASLWTLVFLDIDESIEAQKKHEKVQKEANKKESEEDGEKDVESQEIVAEPEKWWHKLGVITPTLMCVLGLGLVYLFYPGIAPGLLVEFKWINKIDIIAMIMSAVPSVVIAVISEVTTHGPNRPWRGTNWFWHLFIVFAVIEAGCGILFLRVLHYRGTVMSDLLLKRPVVAGAFTVLFYTCHLICIGIGFAAIEPNSSSTMATVVLFLSLLVMNVLEFLGEGYLMEVKKVKRERWPTAGMGEVEAFFHWVKCAGMNALTSLRSVPTLNLRRDLVMASVA